MTEWKTIDSAPKDGTAFLGWGDDDRYPQPMRWFIYDAEDAEEAGEPGFWEYCESILSDIAGEANPTVWMHIPPKET